MNLLISSYTPDQAEDLKILVEKAIKSLNSLVLKVIYEIFCYNYLKISTYIAYLLTNLLNKKIVQKHTRKFWETLLFGRIISVPLLLQDILLLLYNKFQESNNESTYNYLLLTLKFDIAMNFLLLGSTPDYYKVNL